MKKKILSAAALLTESHVEEQLARLGGLVFTLKQLQAEQEKDRVDLNAELLPIKERYRPRQESRAASIEELAARIDAIKEGVREWAEARREDLFTAKRSREMLHAVVGFRLGNFRVETLPRRTWERALYWLGRVTWGRKYLRAEINREQILEDRLLFAAKPERLRRLGLCIVQDETFFVKPKEVRSDALHTMKEAA